MSDLIPLTSPSDKITATGWYDGIDNDRYHGDLCAGPSLSSTGARELLKSCPAKWWANSYLNPNRPPKEDESKFTIGKVAHIALLELDQWDEHVAVFTYKTWQSAQAKLDKAAAVRDGLIPVLEHQAKQIALMRRALDDQGLYHQLFMNAAFERTFVWRNPVSGTFYKARTDAIHMDAAAPVTIIDYKSTLDASKAVWNKRIVEHQLYMQDPWYRAVVSKAIGRPIDRFIFVVQETKYPFLAARYELHHEDLARGYEKNEKAVSIFEECVNFNDWPSYQKITDPPETQRLPIWYQMRLEAQADAGEFDTTRDILGGGLPAVVKGKVKHKRAMNAQAPLPEPPPDFTVDDEDEEDDA